MAKNISHFNALRIVKLQYILIVALFPKLFNVYRSNWMDIRSRSRGDLIWR
nr:MAG TPA: hypothetical protein [Caudoviricetes sp.]